MLTDVYSHLLSIHLVFLMQSIPFSSCLPCTHSHLSGVIIIILIIILLSLLYLLCYICLCYIYYLLSIKKIHYLCVQACNFSTCGFVSNALKIKKGNISKIFTFQN